MADPFSLSNLFAPPRFADFRRSDNVEDRRKEHFNSFPQEPQLPNVFGGILDVAPPNMTNLSSDDFANLPTGSLSHEAGTKILDAMREKYLADRAVGSGVKPTDIHSFDEKMDPNGPPVILRRQPFMDAPAAPNPVLAGRQPGASYNTQLDPGAEQFFRMWVGHNKVPFNPDATAPQDYDMRGFYQALMSGDPKAQSAINPNDSQIHYPDFWKTPLHQSFSNESQWAPADAPQWTPQDALAQGGGVLLDEKAAPFGVPR